ncbi:MAG: hypothetical protein WA673_21860 [Candidatus Acidiferrales bacterium]
MTLQELHIVSNSTSFRRAVLLFVVAAFFCLAPQRTFAAADSASCSDNPDVRLLDFWLGDWIVTYPGASGGGAGKVSLALDKCLVIESWESGTGLQGENVFAYNSEDKNWQGLYADNHGRVHVFTGKVTPGAAEFRGPSRGPGGKPVLNRIKLVRLSHDKVEQSWEKSADNGKTWTTEFRGEYTRKHP